VNVLESDEIDESVFELLETEPELELEIPFEDNLVKIQLVEIASNLFVSKQQLPIYSKLDNKVVPIKGSELAYFLKSSNALGLIAVKGLFQRGLNNTIYSVFQQKQGKYISSSGHVLPGDYSHKYVIASVSSNRGIKNSNLSLDIFSSVERKYIQFLKSSKDSAQNKRSVFSIKQYLDKKKSLIKASVTSKAIRDLERENKILSQALKEANESSVHYQQLKSSMEERARKEMFSNAAQIQKLAAEKQQINSKKNVDYLANLMSKI
jgi:hypothetical protein